MATMLLVLISLQRYREIFIYRNNSNVAADNSEFGAKIMATLAISKVLMETVACLDIYLYLCSRKSLTHPKRMNGNAQAQVGFQVGDLLYTTLTDSQVSVIGLACENTTSIIIPPQIDYDHHTYVVSQIGEKAFANCSRLTSITIPESVEEIGYYAFWCCSALTSIQVMAENTVYDSRNGCNALIHSATHTLIAGCQTTIIPRDVTTIEAGAFSECSGLKSIVIPEGVTTIGDWAFHGCLALRTIALPKTLRVIGDWAFHNCSSLLSVNLPESVTEIGDFAFWGCNRLQSVRLPKTVTYLGEDAIPEG